MKNPNDVPSTLSYILFMNSPKDRVVFKIYSPL